MARRIDQQKRRDLLDQAIEGLAQTGVTDTSLRTLADLMGTSARMLIYYFGSKENLILEVLKHEQQLVGVSEPDVAPTLDGLRAYILADWAALTRGHKKTGVRILEQVFGAACAEDSPYRLYTTQTLTTLTATLAARFVGAGMPAETADLRAHLALSSLQGLLMMYFTAEDPSHIDSTVIRFVDEILLAPW
ncbi:TetR/AcrR family transcriptional regulator [Nocardia rhamnosiphila]|uniref:TetR/AcrR family transcriptional regulator n=1 Tax=Nocardia rhamnosiphila TaxID=426716 RepID=A0ABV2WQH9_9NOCA